MKLNAGASHLTAAALFATALSLVGCGADEGGGGAGTGGAGAAAGGSGGQGTTGGAGGRGGGNTATGGAGGSAVNTGGSGGTTSSGGSGAAGAPDADGEGGSADAAEEDATAADVAAPDSAASKQACPAGPFEAPRAGAAKDICGSLLKYNWTEGPTWIASQQAFYFSNFQVGQAGPGDMLKYTPAGGQCETFLTNVGCNGLGVSTDGHILAACHTPRKLMKYDPVTKAATVLVERVEGKMLDSPNDVVSHSNGTLYFTNPTYELAGRPAGLGPAVLRLDPAGMVSVIARGGVNGIALSPDEKRLYVVFQGSWDLDDQGVPTKKGSGLALGNDGIAVDCAGNVYNAGGGIVSPSGQRVGSFPAGTNMAFGGPEGKTLLVVRGRSARVVEMNVPGLP
jgi:gluconolactonase